MIPLLAQGAVTLPSHSRYSSTVFAPGFLVPLLVLLRHELDARAYVAERGDEGLGLFRELAVVVTLAVKDEHVLAAGKAQQFFGSKEVEVAGAEPWVGHMG